MPMVETLGSQKSPPAQNPKMDDFVEEDFQDIPFCGMECSDMDASSKVWLKRLAEPDTCWACEGRLIPIGAYRAYCSKCGVVVNFT